MIALIDGDELVYRGAFSAQKTNKKEGINAIAPVQYALANTRRMIECILKETASTSYLIYLTDPLYVNYREHIATIKPYKGNRLKFEKPVHYQAVKDFLSTEYESFWVGGQEADDAMAIAQSNSIKYDDVLGDCYSTIICSSDKDMLMIPGLNYNIRKGKIREISEEEGLLNFYCQLITGDSTDNIPGLKGYGDKYPFLKARKYLESVPKVKHQELAYWNAVVLLTHNKLESLNEMVLNRNEVEKRLIETGQLLWIRRQENELWQPPV